MPKRDVAYMAAQRDLIAAAALECLLEKGVAATSIRDICTRAGVSIGAFYTHFSDKEQAVFAACEIDLAAIQDWSAVSTWREYADAFLNLQDEITSLRARQRLRLSYQFAAELALYEGRPPEFQASYDKYFSSVRASLAAIHAAGEIELPLGLEETTALHGRLYYGTLQTMMVNHDLDPKAVFAELVAGLALIAGLKPSVA